MRILSIIAQKPDFTGSGIYLRELVRCFDEENIEQAIICGISKNDEIKAFDTKKKVQVYPVFFNDEKMTFDVVGMSDEMPYKSTKYRDLLTDKEKLNVWINCFSEKIKEVYDSFKPDIIVCHHLYLLTALTRDLLKEVKIHAICHNTDLRQYIKVDKMRDYIKSNMQKVDRIFSPSEDHKKRAIELFSLDEKKIKVVGIGYNEKLFYNKKEKKDENIIKLMYAGKIAKKKGVMSLIKAFGILKNNFVIKDVELDLVGGAGDDLEYNEIVTEANMIGDIHFIGKVSQEKLVDIYNSHDVFILPSFNEGIPMVVIEALSCGMKVVSSDLPGLKSFVDSHVENADIEYVTLPMLHNADEATSDELESYEERLANAMKVAISKLRNKDYNHKEIVLKNLSWTSIAKAIKNS